MEVQDKTLEMSTGALDDYKVRPRVSLALNGSEIMLRRGLSIVVATAAVLRISRQSCRRTSQKAHQILLESPSTCALRALPSCLPLRTIHVDAGAPRVSRRIGPNDCGTNVDTTMDLDTSPLQYTGVSSADMVAEIAALEAASYPADEAATPEKLAFRAKEAGDFFRVVIDPQSNGLVAGFVCATLTDGETLTHDSMSVHKPTGSSLCIHSVVVHPQHRRKGLATAMLRRYLQEMPAQVKLVLLMCKKPLIGLYEGCDFLLVGQSPVVHGKTPWFEMKWSNPRSASSSSSPPPSSSTRASLPLKRTAAEPISHDPRLTVTDVGGDAMLAEITKLEAQSYPADEAASPAKLKHRATDAKAFFKVIVDEAANNRVAGYACGNLIEGDELKQGAMYKHAPGSSTLCIQSVVVRPEYRRRGVATKLLTSYMQRLPETVTKVLLLCKETLAPLYAKCGFKLVGESDIVLGSTPWLEMQWIRDSTPLAAGGKHQFGVDIADQHKLPALAVFDLDACFWDEEMYTLDYIVDRERPVKGPLGDAGVGVIGARSGRDVIHINKGALLALQKFWRGDYPGMRIAAASSADTPHAVKIGRSALDLLEIVPGVTAREVFNLGWPAGFEGNMQIGRTPPLSSNKARSHFPLLKKYTKVGAQRPAWCDSRPRSPSTLQH